MLRYYATTFMYGFCRTGALLSTHPNITVYNYRTKTYEDRKLLMTEKIGAMTLGTCMMPFLAPISIPCDIHRMDMILNDRLSVERPQQSAESVFELIAKSIYNY